MYERMKSQGVFFRYQIYLKSEGPITVVYQFISDALQPI